MTWFDASALPTGPDPAASPLFLARWQRLGEPRDRRTGVHFSCGRDPPTA